MENQTDGHNAISVTLNKKYPWFLLWPLPDNITLKINILANCDAFESQLEIMNGLWYYVKNRLWVIYDYSYFITSFRKWLKRHICLVY